MYVMSAVKSQNPPEKNQYTIETAKWTDCLTIVRVPDESYPLEKSLCGFWSHGYVFNKTKAILMLLNGEQAEPI